MQLARTFHSKHEFELTKSNQITGRKKVKGNNPSFSRQYSLINADIEENKLSKTESKNQEDERDKQSNKLLRMQGMQLSKQFLPIRHRQTLIRKKRQSENLMAEANKRDTYGLDRAGVPVSNRTRFAFCSKGTSNMVRRAFGFLR